MAPLIPHLKRSAETKTIAIYVKSRNTSHRDGSIWGLSSTWVLGPGSADLYYLGLDRQDAIYVQGTDDETRHSISLDYQWGRHLSMDLSYSHFFAGEVIKHAGGDDVQFFKAQAEWKF